MPDVASRMPRIIGTSHQARVFAMQDLSDAQDLTGLYSGDRLRAGEIRDLADYLRALHAGSARERAPRIVNREMRALNHEHIYRLPLDEGNGLSLGGLETGLDEAARRLREDDDFRRIATETGERYLADGGHLVHGDYFPGSWLRTREGIRIIDPEFAFFGDPELDLGCAVAHLALAGQPLRDAARLLGRYASGSNSPRVEPGHLARYAAIEVVRRLIGVAQLPMAPSHGERAALLERARRAMLGGDHEVLWK
jgi:5-methylthioribose kinase